MQRDHAVLVIENDDAVRDALREVLFQDCAVVCVSSLESARRLLSVLRFDVVLLDLLLGDGHGETLLSAMAKHAVPSAPVVVVSGWREAGRIARGYRVPFVRKPFDTDVILSALRSAIDHRHEPHIPS